VRIHIATTLTAMLVLSACAMAPRPGLNDAPQPLAYALDSGDVLRVSVYGEADITGNYRVGDDGDVAIPLVGSVSVRGQSTRSAAARIAAALAKGYMRNPDVAIEVAEYRPFFVNGAVQSSGQYAYAPNLTARAAVSMAGGFIETANRGGVTVYRRHGTDMQVLHLELDQPIEPGDVVSVAERWF